MMASKPTSVARRHFGVGQFTERERCPTDFVETFEVCRRVVERCGTVIISLQNKSFT